MLLRLGARVDELTQGLHARGLGAGGQSEDRRVGDKRGGRDDGRLRRDRRRWSGQAGGGRRRGDRRGSRQGLQGGQGIVRDADASHPGGLLAAELLEQDIQGLCGVFDHGERDSRARARVKSFSVI
jgi:hypothetical protein